MIMPVGLPLACTSTPPATLEDLLSLVIADGRTNAGMLRSTTVLFTNFIVRPPNAVFIDELVTEKESFVRHLRACKYARNSVKSYANYVNSLIKLAEQHGWTPKLFEVPTVWKHAWDSVGECRTSHEILQFAIELGRSPKTFSEEDLTSWRLRQVKRGYTYAGAESMCSRLRQLVTKAGLNGTLPLIRFGRVGYGVTLVAMNPALRAEIKALLQWKTNMFQPGRPAKARVRAITANSLQKQLCRMVGYVQNVLGRPELTSLRALVTEEHLGSYASWAMNDRKLQGQAVTIGLGMLQAAMEHNPSYSDLNLKWMRELASQLPWDSDTDIQERKARKYISFAAADTIPGRIRSTRVQQKNMSMVDRAVSFRNELLMLWLIILPWRQRNIRECRISGAKPNLFFGPVSPFSTATKPKWIEALCAEKPDASFWQFRFAPDETKTGNDVHAFLPHELVVLLEEYLREHRSLLVAGTDEPMTLFVTRKGGTLNQEQLADIVKNMAALHAGRATTPHLFRDIVAYQWLLNFPEDFLTLSKILWHRNIQTTIKKYGRRFDESTGVARMDDWRAKRKMAA